MTRARAGACAARRASPWIRAGRATAVLALAGLATSAAGCAQEKPLYSWRSYEDSLYVMWNRPGKFDLASRMAALSEDVERDRAEDRRPPPGVQAHLGYLHALAGDAAAARQWFAAERADYPESAVFMDRLIARANP